MFNRNEDAPSVNLLSAEVDNTGRRRTYTMAAIFVVVVALLALLGARASYQAVTRGTSLFQEIPRLPVISDIRRLVFGGPSEQSEEDRLKEGMNVLFLGIGGEGHDGGLLTDTIMLASIDFKQNRVSLISFPRDLAYPLGSGRFEKINAVHAYAEKNDPGEGARRTGDALSELLEIPIDRVVRVDFRGFEKLVDSIGGIDVTVERSFVDPQYPTEDEKWMSVSFEKGRQRMNGKTALIYARSRHGSNGEGSDFARSRRQQLVMIAVRDKMLGAGTLSDPRRLASLYQVVSSHVQTDLTPWELLRFAPLAQDFTADKIKTRVLTDGPDGELTAANVNGAFMLFPRKPDWSEIRELAKNPFATSTAANVLSQPITQPVAVSEPVKIEIKNGTTRTGFAAQAAAQLEKDGFEILAFGNANRRGYERTVIYDLSNGKYPIELARLRRRLDASISVTTLTEASTSTPRSVLAEGATKEPIISQNTQFLVILGETSYSLVFQK